MPNIHELLDETQRHCESLVEEMKGFKDAKSLNQKTAENLDLVCDSLIKTTKAIKPFTEVNVRRMFLFVIAATALNAVFFFTILLLMVLQK
jgi:hypothetical protein